MSIAEKYAADKLYGTHISFKTKWRHRKLRFFTHFNQTRPLGLRAKPELVVLEPKEGITPSDKPPVRIYMGTEPHQHRAERILIWSITQVRDPARRYEIYLMKDLAGFDCLLAGVRVGQCKKSLHLLLHVAVGRRVRKCMLQIEKSGFRAGPANRRDDLLARCRICSVEFSGVDAGDRIADAADDGVRLS